MVICFIGPFVVSSESLKRILFTAIMLLDQSLAICLTGNGSKISYANDEEYEPSEEDQQQDVQTNHLEHQQTAITIQDNRLALSLFCKLVERNQNNETNRIGSRTGRNSNHNNHNNTAINNCDQVGNELLSLGDAIQQVTFSGFILPSWLLVSGPIKALQAIRLSWLEAKLQAPPGYAIQSIGK